MFVAFQAGHGHIEPADSGFVKVPSLSGFGQTVCIFMKISAVLTVVRIDQDIPQIGLAHHVELLRPRCDERSILQA